jgi:tetrahydromethanopterin S-methyltransferase subunit B
MRRKEHPVVTVMYEVAGWITVLLFGLVLGYVFSAWFGWGW